MQQELLRNKCQLEELERKLRWLYIYISSILIRKKKVKLIYENYDVINQNKFGFFVGYTKVILVKSQHCARLSTENKLLKKIWSRLGFERQVSPLLRRRFIASCQLNFLFDELSCVLLLFNSMFCRTIITPLFRKLHRLILLNNLCVLAWEARGIKGEFVYNPAYVSGDELSLGPYECFGFKKSRH